MSDLATTPDVETPLPTGPWGALWRILTSPGDAFAVIRARSPLLPPFLLLGLVMAGVTLVTFARLEDFMRDQLSASLADVGEVGLSVDSLYMVSVLTAAGSALVTPLVAGLLLTLVLYVTGLIFDCKARFGQLLSLAGYAEMPALLAHLLSAGLIWFSGEQALQFDLTAAVLVPSLGPGALRTLLTLITPFSIWTWTLLALGLSHVGQMPRRRAWWQIATVFAVVNLTRIAFGQAFSGLAGNFSM